MIRIISLAASAALASSQALAQEGGRGADEELAKQLANPVASLISVPFQFNYDCCTGPEEDDGDWLLNIQPVIPIGIGNDWNLVVRTILPVRYSDGSPALDGEGLGLGDTTQSFFFAAPTRDGLTWAVGPVFYYPTGTDGYSGGKWGAGPTALVLKQSGPLTVGALANHIWSVDGAEHRPDISATFFQPFYNYTWPNTTGFVVNLESSYDWNSERWSVPLNTGITHIFNLGGQKVQLGAFGRLHLDDPDDGGPDWGVRFVATFLFPK